MGGRVEGKTRRLAAFIHAYGWPPGFELDYGTWWGLVLNLTRVQSIGAAATFQGVAAAQPGASPNPLIADAMGEDEDEAAYLEGQMLASQR